MLGYCGINCTECSAYKATVTADEKLMQHVQDTFADGKGTREDWVCLGCLAAEPAFIAKFCATCKIRTCAIEHGITNCAACPDYDQCEQLQPFIETEGAAVVTGMRWLREAFVAEREKKAA
jgi:hypothetical protein